MKAFMSGQLLLFFCGSCKVDNNFCVKEELLDLRSLWGTWTGKDIVEGVFAAINNMITAVGQAVWI